MDLEKKLTLDMAKKISAAAEKTALANNINIAISIYKNDGNPIYFQCMDNVGYIHASIAKLKAKIAVVSPFQDDLANDNITKEILSFGTGLPIITKNKHCIGAIGVSGSTISDLDNMCAQAGLNAVLKNLE